MLLLFSKNSSLGKIMLFATTTHFPKPPPLVRHSTTTFLRRNSIKMSSNNQIIEHIVLFKASPTATPSSISTMLNNLNSLSTLSSVLHLSAGPVTSCRSKSFDFTHMLHSRYASKADLATYTDHPDHVSVVTNYVRPNVEDVMAVDWVGEGVKGQIENGSVARFTVLKLKDEGRGKDEVLSVIRGVKDKFSGIEELTVGENFSPARAKGYSIASVAVFKGVDELKGLEGEMEAAEKEKEKVREFIDEVLVLDFVVGASVGVASL